MGGCITTIFKHWFWAFMFFIFLIMGSVLKCSHSISDKYDRASIRSHLEDDETEDAANLMHDNFVDDFYADTSRVTRRAGALAEEVIVHCIEVGDIESAKQVFRDYKHGLSDYGRPKLFNYMVEHNMPDSLDYK